MNPIDAIMVNIMLVGFGLDSEPIKLKQGITSNKKQILIPDIAKLMYFFSSGSLRRNLSLALKISK